MLPWFCARFKQVGFVLALLCFNVASPACPPGAGCGSVLLEAEAPGAGSDSVSSEAAAPVVKEFMSQADPLTVFLLGAPAPVSRVDGPPGPFQSPAAAHLAAAPDAPAPISRVEGSPGPSLAGHFAAGPHAPAPISRVDGSPGPSLAGHFAAGPHAPAPISRVDGSRGPSPTPAAVHLAAPAPTAGANVPSGPGQAHVPLLAPSNAPSFAPSPTIDAGMGTPVFLPPEDSSPFSGPEGSSPFSGPHGSQADHTPTMVAIIAGVAFGVFIIVAFFVAIVCRFSGRNRAAAVLPWKVGMSGPIQQPFVTAIPAISRAELEVACEDFSNIIGSSSDTIVFKGTLTDGTEIAATSIRMAAECWNSKSEIHFRLKIESFARMNHTHLINLISYCSEDDPFVRMFVFEYASNGTLYEHLHLRESDQLSWPIRTRIIMGAAYGLRYMHHEAVPAASHHNFDSRAIHLTEDYAAKLAEFGASKGAVIKGDRRRSSTDNFNSLDYGIPDLSDSPAPDFECNVYSFGVFLLEVVTGRRPQSEKEGSLVDWATTYINNHPDQVHSMADPALRSFDRSQLESVWQVSRLCTHADPQKRPIMKEVTKMLEASLKLTPEIAAPKGSLLWAELEILATS